jgi:hypothetical protein
MKQVTNKDYYITQHAEVVETIDHAYMILVNGMQWGVGPYDTSGCSYQCWPTRQQAVAAYLGIITH